MMSKRLRTCLVCVAVPGGRVLTYSRGLRLFTPTADRWRPRLRSFFISRENYHRTLASRRLLRLMSPTLRGEVARHLNKVWIHRVPYLRHISAPFLTELAMSLQQEFYAPEVRVSAQPLFPCVRCLILRGVCARPGVHPKRLPAHPGEGRVPAGQPRHPHGVRVGRGHDPGQPAPS